MKVVVFMVALGTVVPLLYKYGTWSFQNSQRHFLLSLLYLHDQSFFASYSNSNVSASYYCRDTSSR